MSSLYRRSTVFAEVKNMVISYDTIVASRLERYFNNNPAARIFFSPTLRDVCILPIPQLVFQLLAEKRNWNFLMDYFDWSKTELSPEDVDPLKICNQVYWEALCMKPIGGDILENPEISGIMTSIGKSFQVLAKDVNLDAIYLYLGVHVPKEIQTGLAMFYGGDIKFKFITGNKNQILGFLQKNMFDSYFFEDSTDVDELLTRHHSNLSEVLLPGNNVNLTIVDEIGGTSLRNPILEYPLERYKEKFNLDVHVMNLPI